MNFCRTTQYSFYFFNVTYQFLEIKIENKGCSREVLSLTSSRCESLQNSPKVLQFCLPQVLLRLQRNLYWHQPLMEWIGYGENIPKFQWWEGEVQFCLPPKFSSVSQSNLYWHHPLMQYSFRPGSISSTENRLFLICATSKMLQLLMKSGEN